MEVYCNSWCSGPRIRAREEFKNILINVVGAFDAPYANSVNYNYTSFVSQEELIDMHLIKHQYDYL